MNTLKFTLIIFFTVLLFSCKKDRTTTHPLVGTWELRADINGLTALRTNYPPGNGRILKFTSSQYEKQEAGKVIVKGNYTLRNFISQLTREETSGIFFDSEPSVSNSLTIEGSTFTLSMDVYDSPGSVYERIGP